MSTFLALLMLATASSTAPALDRSIVVLPGKAGRFVHERSRVGTPEVRDGVDADYGVPGHAGDPWVRVTVVPTGRVDTSDAEQAAALARIRAHPAFVNLEVLPVVPITVAASPRRAPADDAAGATSAAVPPVTVGRRQSFTYLDRDGARTRDAGLVFHRQRADITVRVRVAADDISQADFDALADEAARRIVLMIDICVDGRWPEGGDETGCVRHVAGAAAPAPAGGVRHMLVYPLAPEPTGCRRDGVVLAECR